MRGRHAKRNEELHTELIWNLDQIELLARRFRRSVWIFARNDTATPFITSDNPMTFRTRDNRQWLRAGILSRGTYLAYPMSPQVVLFCHPRHDKFRALGKFADTVSPVVLTEEMVECENTGQVFMASRFLISCRAQFDAERAFAPTIGTDIYAPSPLQKWKSEVDPEAYPAVPGRSRYGMSSPVSRRRRRPRRDVPWPGVGRFRSFKRSSPTRQAARLFCWSVVGPTALFAPVVARNGRRRLRVALTRTSASIAVGKRQSFRER